MQIRQFEASTLKEAVAKVRKSMGPEAIILTTAEGKNGKSPNVVVTAAIDRDVTTPSSLDSDIFTLKTGESFNAPELLASEDRHLRPILLFLREMIDHAIQAHERRPKGQARRWIELLMSRGVERSAAYGLVYKLLTRLGRSTKVDAMPHDLLKKVMIERFSVTGEIKLEENMPRFVVFLGSPGVGKTTTLAKLAARIKQKTMRPIVLLSTDIYRIGAMDQLYIYGDLMGLPVEGVRSKRDLCKVLRSYPPDTLFLVDTTGRSHVDDQGLMEIKILIDNMAKEMWAFLLLDAGKKREDLLDEIKSFSMFSFQSLIWTKVDATGTPGEMFNIMMRTKLPISYITMGQNVPRDIETADPGRLIDIIITDKEPRRFLWTKRQN